MYSSKALHLVPTFSWINKKEFMWILLTTVLSTSLFAWRFVLNEDILFRLTISYQKPFVFSDSVFSSQIFTEKLNLWPKNGLTYVNSIVK